MRENPQPLEVWHVRGTDTWVVVVEIHPGKVWTTRKHEGAAPGSPHPGAVGHKWDRAKFLGAFEYREL